MKTYIIIKEQQVHIPGDERSRTNPGHGYPAHTDNYQLVEYFIDIDKWKKEVAYLKSRIYGPKFKAGVFIEADIRQKIEIEVNLPE